MIENLPLNQSENIGNLNELESSAKKLCYTFEALAESEKEIPKKEVERLLVILDTILLIDANYPVYKFLPKLVTLIDIKTTYKEFATQKVKEFLSVKNWDQQNQEWNFLKTSFMEFTILGCKTPDNTGSPDLDDIVEAWEEKRKKSFTNYVRIYYLKQNVIEQPIDIHSEEDTAVNSIQNEWVIQTMLSEVDLTPYIKNHESNFFTENTKIDLSDIDNQKIITTLLEHCTDACDTFLKEVKFTQTDLENPNIIDFISYHLFPTNEIEILHEYFATVPKYEVFCRFFDNIKLILQNLENEFIHRIIEQIADIKALTALNLLAELFANPETRTKPKVKNLLMTIINNSIKTNDIPTLTELYRLVQDLDLVQDLIWESKLKCSNSIR